MIQTTNSPVQDARTLAQIRQDNELATLARDQAVQASLARLLSSENIHVEFRKTRTASFNVKSRVLIIPVFAPDLKAETVAMLVEHEVGHALYTPPEGWHGALCKRGPGFKSYLNVMEDVRIERKIKAKFPGTRKDFFLGYQDLIAQRFFGDLSAAYQMQLIDKINIYCKAGPTVADFRFTPEEQVLLERAQKADTWDEVVDVALAVVKFDITKQQEEDDKFNQMFPKSNSPKRGNQDTDDYDDEDDNDEDEADLDDLEEPSIPDPSGSKKGDDLSDMDDDAEQEEADAPQGDQTVYSDESEESEEGEEGSAPVPPTDMPETPSADGLDDEEEEADPAAPVEHADTQGSVTPKDRTIDAIEIPDEKQADKIAKSARMARSDESFRNREHSLFDAGARDVIYYDIATPPALDSVLVDYKRIQEVLVNNYVTEAQYANRNMTRDTILEQLNEAVNKAVKSFRKRHEAYVTNLVRIFELKKNAAQFSRSSEAKTGQLNLNKMHQYKFNDDLFKKVMNIPKGKNHGVLMFVDFSGSMNKTIRSVMEQAAVLGAFCRRINVPFRVCTFTDGSSTGKRLFKMGDVAIVKKDEMTFKYDDDVFIAEFMSDKMTMQEFNRAIYFTAASGFNYLRNRFQMGGTPLDQTILQLPAMVSAFRRETGAEKITAIYLTDGGSTDHFFPGRIKKEGAVDEGWDSYDYLEPTKHDVRFKNSWNRKSIGVEPQKREPSYYAKDGSSYTSFSYTQAIIRTVREVTGCNVIGYYIVSGQGASSMIREYKQYTSKTEEQLRTEFREQYFMSFENFGYNEYFFIWDKALSGQAGAGEATVNDLEAKTNRGLASAFTKMKTDAARNRVFVTKFMSLVAG
jgi:hypothetical protein